MSKENIVVWLGLFGTGWVDVKDVLVEMQISLTCLGGWVKKDWVDADYPPLIRHEVKLSPRALRKLKGKDTH